MIFNTDTIVCLLPTFLSLPSRLPQRLTDPPCSRTCALSFPSLAVPHTWNFLTILQSVLTKQTTVYANSGSSHIYSPCWSQAESHHTSWHDLFMSECSQGREHTHLLPPAPTMLLRNRCVLSTGLVQRQKKGSCFFSQTQKIHVGSLGRYFPWTSTQ